MPIKMIVTDLDRTLLRTDKTISDYTADVLKHCQQRDIKVVFATARPMRTVKQFFDIIPADAVILHNGAGTYIENEPLCRCGIPASTAQRILLSINEDFPKAALSVEIDDVFYANFDVSTIWNNTQAIITDFTDLPKKDAEKIIVGVISMDDIEIFSKYLPDDLYIEMSDGNLGLIMHRRATKFQGVQVLSQHYNVDIDDIVAFGDDFNDIDMIQQCGVGVAMNNALDEVKAVANQICETNDDDGVANWIEKNLLYSK